MNKKPYEKANVKIKNSMATIEGVIDSETLESYKTLTLENMKKNLEIPGFRKGNAPDQMVVNAMGEGRILEETANLALRNAYPRIIEDNHIETLSMPHIRVTKLAWGNSLEFRIEVAVMPEYSLPNYRKIAKGIMAKKETQQVTEEEIHDVIKEIQKMRGKETMGNLTDDTVKELGNFKNLEELKEKIRQNLLGEKELAAQRKIREDIIAAIAKEVSMTLPSVIVEGELQRTEDRLERELQKRNMKREEYFQGIKKTEEVFWKEEESTIKEHVKNRLILKRVAQKENVEADEKQVEHELSHLKSHYPDADENRLREYVEEILINEEVFKRLEQ